MRQEAAVKAHAVDEDVAVAAAMPAGTTAGRVAHGSRGSSTAWRQLPRQQQLRLTQCWLIWAAMGVGTGHVLLRPHDCGLSVALGSPIPAQPRP